MIILSTLINEKIVHLDFRPLTHAKKKTDYENIKQIECLKNKRYKKTKDKILNLENLSSLEKEKKIRK